MKQKSKGKNQAIKWAAMGCVLAAFTLSTAATQTKAAAKSKKDSKPNIVFMMADNLGYGDVGVYGGGELRGAPTPRIDSLASEGLRMTQFLVEPG